MLAADIEKMFRQIEIHSEDRDFQRILWRERSDGEVKEFQLNRVTYGLTSAPFLAIRTFRQLAEDEKNELPLSATVLLRDIYMDDIFTGAATIQEAKEIQRQLVKICTAGGFPLKKWSANDAALLEELLAADRLLREPRWWLPGESHYTLGLRWHPHEDRFSYVTRLTLANTISKRTVLSLTSKLFDPLGWLAPTTVRAKIFFQSTWLLDVDWDVPLPVDDERRWREFHEELPLLEAIRIPDG